MLKYEEIDKFKGDRSVSANSLREALVNYKCNPALNPITDFKEIMKLMQKQYNEACGKAILNPCSEGDAKHLFYEALIRPEIADK